MDGVLLIGEHGDYPYNEQGQHIYPAPLPLRADRRRLREQRPRVPVFNDKHLAYDWADAKWMYDRARALDVPFLAGSSLPACLAAPVAGGTS